MQNLKSKVAELVARLPEPDEKGMLSKIDKKVVDEVTRTIYQGGPDSILALIDSLVEPAVGDDYKQHYALHCLVLHANGLERREKRAFTSLLGEQINSDRPKAVRGYLIRELQLCGGRSACEQLGKAMADPELFDDAVMALTAIGGRSAAEQLRNALPAAAGRARMTIIQNLGVLADEQSAPALTAALTDGDREMRLAAAWALANIAQQASVAPLLKAADTDKPYERIKATKACMLLAEKLTAKGESDAAGRIYKHLAETRTGEDEAYVRDAAKAALAG